MLRLVFLIFIITGNMLGQNAVAENTSANLVYVTSGPHDVNLGEITLHYVVRGIGKR